MSDFYEEENQTPKKAELDPSMEQNPQDILTEVCRMEAEEGIMSGEVPAEEMPQEQAEIPAEKIQEEEQVEDIEEEVSQAFAEKIQEEVAAEEERAEAPAEEMPEIPTEEIPAEETLEIPTEGVPAEETQEISIEEVPTEEDLEISMGEVPAEPGIPEKPEPQKTRGVVVYPDSWNAEERTAYRSRQDSRRAASGGGGGDIPGGGTGIPEEPPKKKGSAGKIIGIAAAMVLVVALVGGGAWAITRLISGGESQKQTVSSTAESTEETAAEESGETGETEETEASYETQIAQADTSDSNSEGSSSSGVTLVDVSDVVTNVLPSVVAITNTYVYENYFYDYFNSGSSTYEVEGSGSGIILGDNGTELWIVTNNHVVEDATSLTITFCDDTTAEAYIKGTDEDNDLAMVGVLLSDLSDETKSSICAVELGDSDTLEMGEGVIAIGNALGFGQSVTTGVVSALNREVTMSDGTTMTLIQTDAAINPGNSGGALLDSDGKLIGINVAKYSDSDVEGMGFAIPISQVKEILEELSLSSGGSDTTEAETVSEDEYPYLGVQIRDVASSMIESYGMPEGIMVIYVEEDSPAEEAGIQANDIITAFEGETVTSYEELNELLQYVPGGTTVTITIMRIIDGAYTEMDVTVTLGYRVDYQS